MAGVADMWRITPEERAKHDQQFMSLKPVGGMVTGEQARNFFLLSGLPPPVLGHIWGLADMNADGKMDKKEFSIAVYLIQKKLKGIELPKVLPPSLKEDPVAGGMGALGALAGLNMGAPAPSPVMMGGSATLPPGARTGLGLAGPGVSATLPRGIGMANGTQPVMGFASAGAPLGGPVSSAPQPRMPVASGEWAVPQSSKLKYTQMFNMQDRMKRGFLGGMEARAILTQSHLTHPVLAQIWSLADIDNDGKLTCDEFVLAMHLVDMAKGGQVPPAKLPPDLVPPSYRRIRSGSVPAGGVVSPPSQSAQVPVAAVPAAAGLGMAAPQNDTFGDLLGGLGMAPTPATAHGAANGVPANPDDAPSILSQPVTFEDKRKENFDKGAAELEKRRQALKEMQEKEEAERLAHEKAEQEKREKQRLEQERKKQAEMERLLEKQRQIEQQKEEERRKALEQREAARRELERQRQLEWERQRKEQLMAEKHREQMYVDGIRTEVSRLTNELDQQENKKAELKRRIETSKDSVQDFTSSIDGMRVSRDMKNSDIERFQNEVQELNQRFQIMQAENLQLEGQVAIQNNTMGDSYKTVLNTYNNKKQNIQRLKTRLEMIEKETQAQMQEIENTNAQLNELNNKLSETQAENQRLRNQFRAKQQEWNEFKRKRDGLTNGDIIKDSTDSFGLLGNTGTLGNYQSNDWSSAFANTDLMSSNVAWGTASPSTVESSSSMSTSTQEKPRNSWALDSMLQSSFFSGISTGSASASPNLFANFPDNKSKTPDPQGTSEQLGSLNVEITGQTSLIASGDGAIPSQNNSLLSPNSSSSTMNEIFNRQHSNLSVVSQATTTSQKSIDSNVFGSDPFASDKNDDPFASEDPFNSANSQNDIFGEASPTKNDAFGSPTLVQDDTKQPSSDTLSFMSTNNTSSNKNYDNFEGIFSGTGSSNTGTADWGPGPSALGAGEPLSTSTTNLGFGAFSGTQTSQNSGWGDSFSSIPQGSVVGFKKYKAMYQFDARNADELSLKVGDIVHVKPDQTGVEPGWMCGSMDGAEGIFPEAYVEFQEEITAGSPEAQSVTSPANETAPSLDDSQALGSMLTTSVDSSFTAVAGTGPSPTPGQNAPAGLKAQALYPWRAKKDNHLTFDKGDVILVKEQQDMWWSGELNGSIGWFPKSYVKLLGDTVVSPPQSPAAVQQADAPVTSSALPVNIPEGAEVHVALYTYSSSEQGDLSFNQGEYITITEKDGDWWTGTIGDRTGIFPANYVKKVDTPQVVPSVKISDVTADVADTIVTSPVDVSTAEDKGITDTSVDSQHETDVGGVTDAGMNGAGDGVSLKQPVQKAASKKPEIASVIAPYQATGPEQLSLSPGQLISVRKKSPSGWWEGELQARGQKRRIGWFPANYVKLLGTSRTSTPLGTDAKRNSLSASPNKSGSPNPDGSRTETPVPSYPQPSTAPALEQVVAMYTYSPQNDDELQFHKGSVINVINKDDPDWWRGELNGTVGMFPSNYVSPLAEAMAQGEAQSYYSNSDLSAGTPVDTKRQNYIEELIDTEEVYMADMSIVIEAFHEPIKNENALTEEENESVFVNWNELTMCNMKLLKALRVRKKMTAPGDDIAIIGDILCENLPHMAVYIRFCSCQLNAAALIQRKTENDSHFRDVMKKCQQNPKTKGMPLSSFLLKPMQRITRYPLMIEKILSYTPADHPDHQNLVDALNKANETCSQVNEGVREKENSDKLEWLQTHIQCDGLPEKITFNSITNCLGPRKFLHSGGLTKTKSGKELYAFLFNDFLLLTQPSRAISDKSIVFNSDSKLNVKFKMYRNPIFLNEVAVKKSTEESESCLFHISHIDKIYSLKTEKASERELWVKKLEESSRHYMETEKKKRERAHSYRYKNRSSYRGRLLVVLLEGKGLAARDSNSARLQSMKGCGRILIMVMEGINLIPSDENGKSDPYCEVSMGVQEHRTRVINNTLNPRWNASMQFTIKDPQQDVLCITVYDRDLFTPNDFLGRTEVRIKDILKETHQTRGPIIKRLLLHEVETGEVIVKLDLQLYERDT